MIVLFPGRVLGIWCLRTSGAFEEGCLEAVFVGGAVRVNKRTGIESIIAMPIKNHNNFFMMYCPFLPRIRDGSKRLLLINQIDYRNLRRGEKTDRRAPCPRSPADIKMRLLRQIKISCVFRKKKLRHKIEGKNLSFMGMSGKLQIKQADGVSIRKRLMFEQQGKSFTGTLRQQAVFGDFSAETYASSRRIVDACDVDDARYGFPFAS